MMKNLKKYLAVVTLVSVLGVSNAFAVGIIQGSPRPSSGFSVSGLMADVYDYFAEMFTADDAEQTNDAGIIHSSPKPVGIIISYTNDVGIIHQNKPK